MCYIMKYKELLSDAHRAAHISPNRTGGNLWDPHMRLMIIIKWICISFVQQGEGIAEAVISWNRLSKNIFSGGGDVSFTTIGLFNPGLSHVFKYGQFILHQKNKCFLTLSSVSELVATQTIQRIFADTQVARALSIANILLCTVSMGISFRFS